MPHVQNTNHGRRVSNGEKHAIDMRPSPIVKHANWMSRIEALRGDLTAVRMSIKRQDGPFESIEPRRTSMRRLLNHPPIQLFEVALPRLRDLNAESHTSGAADRRLDVRV